MTTSSAVAGQAARTESLALAFQEVFIVIVRTRFRVQEVISSEGFREDVKRMLSFGMKKSAATGYSEEVAKMAFYAMVGFLDETVLTSKDPVFSGWRGRSLQQEFFGNEIAGEVFYRNLSDLLNRSESGEIADALELHALCLLLGYRGRYAFGDAAEIQTILRRIQDKIGRIRGASRLFAPTAKAEAPPVAMPDPWIRRLTVAAILLAAVAVLFYAGYWLILSQASATAQRIGVSGAESACRVAAIGYGSGA